MALMGSWQFNENDINNVRDYSTKGLDSASVSGLTIVASDRGLAGRFQIASNSRVNFGDVGSPGADKLTISFKIKFLTTATDQFIIDKNGEYRIEKDSIDKIKFSVFIGTVQKTVRSTTSFSAGTWHRIICKYDGADMQIIVDETIEATTTPVTGNLDTGTDDLLLGHKAGAPSTLHLDADIEVIEIRDADLTTDEIATLDKNMGGIETTLLTKHNFSEGDLLEWVSDIAGLSNSRVVCTLNKDATTILIIPISGRFLPGLRYRRRGNLFDTTRQWLAEIKETAGKPYIFFSNEISAFGSDTPDASSVLDLSQVNDRGVLLPSLTTTERDAIASPATSLLFFNETTGQLETFNGTTFETATPPAGSDKQIQFNDGGAFGGDANFTWNKGTQILSVTGDVGIGITPTEILHISGSGLVAEIIASTTTTGIARLLLQHTTGGTDQFVAQNLGTARAGTSFGVSNNNLALLNKTGNGNLAIGTLGTGLLVLGTNNIGVVRIDSSQNVVIGTTVALAQMHIDQSSTTAAEPVLFLDQADISEEMIEFNTTIGTGNAIEAVGSKVLTTTHFIKVTIPGGLTRYIPVGTIADAP